MKRILILLLLTLTLPCICCAQTIQMEDAHLSFDFYDDWLVVSPQLALVYEPILTQAGIDARELSGELASLGVHSRAYNADFSEWISVMTMDGEMADAIFDIERITDAQRRTLRTRATGDSLWETTGLRAQDAEWQRENGVYWLYVHYTRTSGGETIGRGIRYMTIRNGQFVMLDWQTNGRRFSNANLRTFRSMLSKLKVTEIIDEPVRTVSLTAAIPTETNTGAFTVSGTATAGANLTVTAPDAQGGEQLLCIGEVKNNGSFSLLIELEDEGSYDITLTASAEGMITSSVSGTVRYSANTLPVSLSGIEDGGVMNVTTDTVTITGETLPGVQMQFVSPYGMTRKRAANDGTFTLELTTREEGEYRYTLICDRDGYKQRRIQFTLNRVMTDDQNREAIRKSAVTISYRELQRDLEKNRGQIMRIYGPVAQVSQSGSTQYVRMYYNKDGNGQWYNDIIVTANEDMGVKVGDMLTVVASVAGVYEEQDANGDPVMIPRLDLVFVDAVE